MRASLIERSGFTNFRFYTILTKNAWRQNKEIIMPIISDWGIDIFHRILFNFERWSAALRAFIEEYVQQRWRAIMSSLPDATMRLEIRDIYHAHCQSLLPNSISTLICKAPHHFSLCRSIYSPKLHASYGRSRSHMMNRCFSAGDCIPRTLITTRHYAPDTLIIWARCAHLIPYY